MARLSEIPGQREGGVPDTHHCRCRSVLGMTREMIFRGYFSLKDIIYCTDRFNSDFFLQIS